MSVVFPFSRFSSCYFILLLVMTSFHLCLSNTNSDSMLCLNDERQALLEFKHGLIDDADRLASWVPEEKSDCCKWAGIVCNNITGYVHKIHLPGHDCIGDYDKAYEECLKKKLKGDLGPALLNLKKLMHLDLSGNDFEGKKIPRFVGSLTNLKYLNLSRSEFGGSVPPQLGNLSELRTLSLEGFEGNVMNMQWLSGLRFLRHLDLSGVDLSKAIDWLQVINTLPSLVELHLSNSQMTQLYPHVASRNLTSLSLLDLSENDIGGLIPRWIFSITSLVSLDLTSCFFHGLVPNSSEGFQNMTSLESLHVSENDFMDSSFVLNGLSSSNLKSLDISVCGVSSFVLDSLHNLTSLLTLDLSNNYLTTRIPKSLGNLCNLRDLELSGSSFRNTSLTFLLQSFFECKSPSLESLSIQETGVSGDLPHELGQLINLVYLRLENNHIVGTIPDSIGQLSLLKYLYLGYNLISGQIPSSIGRLLSLEVFSVSNNQLNGSLSDSLGLLSDLKELEISHNLLNGVVTDAHFANLNQLTRLRGSGNNLILRPRLLNWHPYFRLKYLSLDSWDLGPQFPSWLLQQSNLIELEISNTRISSTLPPLFWSSFPNLRNLDMSHNSIHGRLLSIPNALEKLDLSYNKFSGKLPELSNGSMMVTLDLSHNSFVGPLYNLICSGGDGMQLYNLNLANNLLSGAIPNQCWEKHPILHDLNLENNNLSGVIPENLGSLSSLYSLSLSNNSLSGTLPTSLKNLTELSVLQLAKNKFVGRIPGWFETENLNLKILNLRSNNFQGDITHEICYLTYIQILDLADNNLSGNIPRCFNNFTILCDKEDDSYGEFFPNNASLVIKGREDTYSTILRFVLMVDLSSNKLSGDIPSELMALSALQSLNLSRNQLTGSIPKKIGDMKSLVSFDVSLNKLSGELPMSLSSLNFLSSFNVSYNNFTGRVPTSTQLQSFDNSSFVGNKLCGDPLTKSCVVGVQDADHKEGEEETDGSHRADWGLIISMVSGFIVGFWVVVVPLMVSIRWRIAYYGFIRELRYMISDVIRKYWCNMFHK